MIQEKKVGMKFLNLEMRRGERPRETRNSVFVRTWENPINLKARVFCGKNFPDQECIKLARALNK